MKISMYIPIIKYLWLLSLGKSCLTLLYLITIIIIIIISTTIIIIDFV